MPTELQADIDFFNNMMDEPFGGHFVSVLDAATKYANSRLIDIVFDGPPGHVAGRFVEVENQDGASIRVGEWIERDDGYWVLRLAAFGITEEEKR